MISHPTISRLAERNYFGRVPVKKKPVSLQAASEETYQHRRTAPIQLALSDEQLHRSGFQILTQCLWEQREINLTLSAWLQVAVLKFNKITLLNWTQDVRFFSYHCQNMKTIKDYICIISWLAFLTLNCKEIKAAQQSSYVGWDGILHTTTSSGKKVGNKIEYIPCPV